MPFRQLHSIFLSIQAQDFIEESSSDTRCSGSPRFLSIQAQDFIEERANAYADAAPQIPEHSSSGLH